LVFIVFETTNWTEHIALFTAPDMLTRILNTGQAEDSRSWID
jgi:hypothetical protein